MAVDILTELEKVNKVSFELDLGFSFIEFETNYRKRFHSNSYTEYSVQMFYTKEELILFEVFFTETLEYGTLNVNLDLGIGEGVQEYEFSSKPEFSSIQGDLYNVSFTLLKKHILAGSNCLAIKNCLNSLIENLEGNNNFMSNNVIAPNLKVNLGLCLTNFEAIIKEDINTYIEKKILLENYE